MTIKTPQINNPEAIAAILEQLSLFCGDAHFVVSVLPAFDENGEAMSDPFHLSTLEQEQIPFAIKKLLEVAGHSDDQGTTKRTAIDIAKNKSLH